MVEVYYYLPVKEVENAVECGLKLSRWAEKEVLIAGEGRKCLAALLNPKDDLHQYKSGDVKCVKLAVDAKYCFVADRHLYRAGLGNERAMALYNASVIPVEQYIFGAYRIPEVLVTSTLIPGQVQVLDRRLDIPILFDSSEELYMNNILETFKDAYRDFNDALLYSFFSRMSDAGRMERIEDRDNRLAVFSVGGKVYTIKIPDWEQYQL